MSGVSVGTIYAVSDELEYPLPIVSEENGQDRPGVNEERWEKLIPDNDERQTGEEEDDDISDPSADPELCLYRERTVGLLKRYCRMAMETGRLPSLLGREFFRAKVTGYAVCTFEEVIIFVHDVEQCLAKLDRFGQRLVALIVMEEYSQEDAAEILFCTERTVRRHFRDTLDRLSKIFLEGGILRGLSQDAKKSCQGGKDEEICVSDC